MNNKLKKTLILGVLAVLVLACFSGTAKAASNGKDKNEDYKKLLSTTDSIIRSVRLGGKITENRIDILENQYKNVFGTTREAYSDIQDIEPSDITVEEVKKIREEIVNQADDSGVGLSFVYKFDVLIILGVSFTLAVVVNMISRTVVDWKEVNKVRDKQSELQDELKKAKKENDTKKVHKLEKEQQQFMQEHMGTMFSPMKTMLIIIIPFIIVFQILSSTYGGWAVAWLPFNLPWPDIGFFIFDRFFSGTVASLGFFGWYLLSYFGFSQLWRKILVPN